MTHFQALEATRYLLPLKEGGSLPAIVDTIDSAGSSAGLVVVKFRGAGQGVKALIAELIVGGLARALGFKVPELSLVRVAEEFGTAERDPEIQDILRGSRGLNVGLRYLEGAFNFDAAWARSLSGPFASRLVWFDALTFQIDRTPRNPNLLSWSDQGQGLEDDARLQEPWLIDHGAALFPHHDWESMTLERASDPFPFIKDHVLLAQANDVPTAHRDLAPLALQALPAVLAALPAELIADVDEEQGAKTVRERYRVFLEARLRSKEFSDNAHQAHLEESR